MQNLAGTPDFFKRIIDSLESYAIFAVDADGRVRSWNAGAELILGYSEKEIIGKSYSAFFTKPDIKNGLLKQEFKNARKGHLPINEGWRVRKNGELFWATGFIFPLKDSSGKILGFTEIMRDRTERKRIEDQKDFFLDTASHELKTPLTSLKLFSEILDDQAKELGDKQLIESSGIIRSQVDRLVSLMGALLDVSKIQAGAMDFHFSSFDVGRLIEEVIVQVQKTLSTHNIVYIPKAKRRVHGDRVRIFQVVMNLVTNAIKYSPRAEKIVVKTKEKDESVFVEIKDYGIGISKKEHDKIFGRFFRTTHAKRQNISGLGLGLHISSEIIKRHGSRIRVASVPGKGSVFSFSLPVSSLKSAK